jgi:hypothetical protein
MRLGFERTLISFESIVFVCAPHYFTHVEYTLQQKFHLCIPFHTHVSVSGLYIQRIGPHMGAVK